PLADRSVGNPAIFHLRWLWAVMDDPFISSRDQGFYFESGEVARGCGMKLRIVVSLRLPEKEFAAEGREVVQLHIPLRSKRKQRAITDERRHLSRRRLHLHALIPFIDRVSSQVRPSSAREFQFAPRAGHEHGREQNFIAQHKDTRLRVEICVARELY